MALTWRRMSTYIKHRFLNFFQSRWEDGTYVSTENPVVIGGAGRSGTTLLSVILNAHPEVYCGDEHGLLSREGTSIQQIADVHSLDEDRLKQIAEESATRWQFLEQVIRVIKSSQGSSEFATKNPTYMFDLPTILTVFPNTRFIHMYRDGRDVAVSMRDNPDHVGVRYDATYDEDEKLSLEYCAQTWRTFINAYRSFETDDRTHAVSYEDLVTNPSETTRRLCDFLNIEFVSSMVRDHKRGLQSREDATREHHQRLRRSISDDRVQNWKEELTDEQVQEFEQHAGPALRYMGYTVTSEAG